MQLPNRVVAFPYRIRQYIKEEIKNAKTNIANKLMKMKMGTPIPFSPDYIPAIDLSPELDTSDATY